MYLKDHDSFEISNGLWNWHSQGFGGKNVVDYLIKVRGFGFVDAVRHLVGEEITPVRTAMPKAKPPTVERPAAKRQLLKLPRRFENNMRVIAYLRSRGIDRNLIQECIKQNILYESADYHNAVFVGRDENGKARFAAMRGTLGSFKRDADGSDKRFGFVLPPENGGSVQVAVFESPIDALSHKMVEPEYGGYRLSLGGTAVVALTRFIELHPEIERITVCTDNDEAGRRSAADIEAKFGGKVTRSLPPSGKDWNDALLSRQRTAGIHSENTL
ncbi:MAG: DUF3991 and toprim domain-containing protein [Oscillospiraceae bacterium]|jgi:hypothetical protein|nr:DUF3991 and toprim domain-containing protein [Oscillospiraceae bacterium]